MYLKEESNKLFIEKSRYILKLFFSKIINFKNKKTILFFAVCFFILSFFTGYFVKEKGKLWLLEPYAFIKKNMIKIHAMFTSKPKKVFLDISYKNFQKIAYYRELALQKKVLTNDYKGSVPAFIRYDDKRIPIKIRLKGDWTDHLRDKKWSYRVELKGDNVFLGMRNFSLQHPKTRNFLYEYLYHKIMNKNDVLSLRYDFVELFINGENFGIYAIEEHFSRELIEANKRREGIILKFDESYYWKNVARDGRKMALYPHVGTFMDSNIDAFDMKKIKNKPELLKQFLRGRELLECFRRGDKSVEEVFDIDRLASFYALSDILHADHGTAWNNRRFYYNPITDKIEPIAYDGMCGIAEEGWYELLGKCRTDAYSYKYDYEHCAHHNIHNYKLFRDDNFFGKYIKNLRLFSKKEYWDNFFQEISEDLNDKVNILHREWPYYNSVDKNKLYESLKFVESKLDADQALSVYIYDQTDKNIKLQIANKHIFPIELRSITIKGRSSKFQESNLLLEGKDYNSLLDFKIYTAVLPKGIAFSQNDIKDIKINARFLGDDIVYSSDIIFETLLPDTADKEKISSILDNSHEMFEIDDINKVINIKKGEWQITSPFFIPSGYRVYCPSGVKIDLTNNSFIKSFSPFYFNGSGQEKITITSSDLKGQGLYINTNEESIFKHVIFEKLSAPSIGKWALTGAVSIYRSKVKFMNCSFVDNLCEDGLNLVDSYFIINDSIFSGASSDALDLDFCKGDISNCQFYNSGNDSLDFSGSVVNVKNVSIFNAQDKGISGGEKSALLLNNIYIFKSNIGIASKDSSKVKGNNVLIDNCGSGLVIFQKKPEYGGASVDLINADIKETKEPFLIEKGSMLSLNGKDINGTREDLADFIYGEAK